MMTKEKRTPKHVAKMARRQALPRCEMGTKWEHNNDEHHIHLPNKLMITEEICEHDMSDVYHCRLVLRV